ncbi:MAG: hypothetical protein QM726_15760 [Chitinophagaceae bacterium]
MTPRTLFSIIVKVFGLFFIKNIFETITDLLPTIYYLMRPELTLQGMVTMAVYILYILMYALLAYYLIVKSDLVIDKLKLDKEYDQEIFQFNMHRSTVLSIALIVIGGLLIVEGIPTFLRHLSTYYFAKRDMYRSSDATISYMIVSGSKIIIGFLILAEKKKIINFVEAKRKS